MSQDHTIDFGDTVRVAGEAPIDFRPGQIGSATGFRRPRNDPSTH